MKCFLSISQKSIVSQLTIIVLIFTIQGVSFAAATFTHIYVDAVNGVNAPIGRGTEASPYQSITFALLISERNKLPDPWHVHINPGNYNGDAAKGNAREIFPLKLRREMIFEGTTTAEECIIDGQHTGASTVPILHGVDTEVVIIRNLTVQNSLRTNGVGGIVLHDLTGTKETPSTIENCVVHNNKGGGVWSNMPLILTGNTFSNNHGTGVATTKSTAATNNTFSGNHWTGLYMSGDSTGDISKNIFRNNRNVRDAAGLHIGGTLEGNITRNTFTGNIAEKSANSFKVVNLTGDVTYNTFTRNVDNKGNNEFEVWFLTGNVNHNVFIGNKVATHYGSGFSARELIGDVAHNEFNGFGTGFNVDLELTGNIIQNKFIRNGQGFNIQNDFTGNVTRNIFDSNSYSGNWAGGFHFRSSKITVEVSNNIFFNNTGYKANSVYIKHATTHIMNNLFMISDELSRGVSNAPTVRIDSPNCQFHNNIFSNVKTAIYTAGTFDLPITHNLFHNVRVDFVEQAGNNLGNDLLFWELVAVNATDNLEGDPQLVDPVTTRDFHLQATSPAIDAGTNAFAPADDFDGVVRPIGAAVDIGPYEYGGTPVVTTQEPPADDTESGDKGENTFPLTTEEAPIVNLYWVTDGKIQRADLDGANIEDVIHQENREIRRLAIDPTNGKIYWSERTNGIFRADLSDGTNIEHLVKTDVGYYAGGRIALDVTGNQMYWTNSETNSIFRANLDGTDAKEILKLIAGNPVDIALDISDGKMYWTQWRGNASISRANLDGSNVELLINTSEIGDIALDVANNKMYWTNGFDSIGMANLDGTNVTNFETPDYTTGGITLNLSNSTMYWIDGEGSEIRRGNLDGSQQRTIIKSASFSDIALGTVVVSSQPETPSDPPPATYPAWDVNEDGNTDIIDLVAVAAAIGSSSPENPRLDVNGDGNVNIQDLILVASHLGESSEPAAPVIIALPGRLSPETLQQGLNLLHSQSDGSLGFQRAIANLEQLLATVQPKKTALLANYPNPFNPETWIPYQLAKPASVSVTIYGVNGKLIRTLTLGYQAAGVYHTRTRAAYWDGKNEIGETVASGVYFYTLTAGDFTATRRMLIRK